MLCLGCFSELKSQVCSFGPCGLLSSQESKWIVLIIEKVLLERYPGADGRSRLIVVCFPSSRVEDGADTRACLWCPMGRVVHTCSLPLCAVAECLGVSLACKAQRKAYWKRHSCNSLSWVVSSIVRCRTSRHYAVMMNGIRGSHFIKLPSSFSVRGRMERVLVHLETNSISSARALRSLEDDGSLVVLCGVRECVRFEGCDRGFSRDSWTKIRPKKFWFGVLIKVLGFSPRFLEFSSRFKFKKNKKSRVQDIDHFRVLSPYFTRASNYEGFIYFNFAMTGTPRLMGQDTHGLRGKARDIVRKRYLNFQYSWGYSWTWVCKGLHLSLGGSVVLSPVPIPE
jgi:hypothetical protein